MDPVSLAALIVPFLVKGAQAVGGKIWDRVGDAAADETVGFARRLLARLVPSGPAPDQPAQAAVAEAVDDLVAGPDDEDTQAALRVAVRKLLASDPELLEQLSTMVETQAPTIRAGDRSVIIGGSSVNSSIVTGDSNQIHGPT